MKKLIVLIAATVTSFAGTNAFADGIIIPQPASNQVEKMLQSAQFAVYHGVDASSLQVSNVKCSYKIGIADSTICAATDSKGESHTFDGVVADLFIDDLTSYGVKSTRLIGLVEASVNVEVPAIVCNAGIVTRFKYICSIQTAN